MEVVMKRAVPIAFALMFALHVPTTNAQSAPRKDIPAIAKAANGAIVSIVMNKGGRPFAQGSGFVVRPDGVIVTNYHVIAEGTSAVVKFPDGTEFAVDGVVASDKTHDVAVIKTHGKTFRTLVLGNSDQLQVGEEVVAIGNPLSLESTVSNGIVSAIRVIKEEGKYLQITAPISHGSSGGPLFNMAGEVIGITAGGFAGGENLNFAVPINEAKRLLLNQSATLQNLPNERPRAGVAKIAPKEEHNASELRDTLQWMYHSLDDAYGHSEYMQDRVKHLVETQMAKPEDGCQIMLHTWEVSLPEGSENPLSDFYAGKVKLLSKEWNWLNLSYIDPNTVSFQGDEFSAKTTNEEDEISSELDLKMTVIKTKTNSILFRLDPDYGLRFTKAFKYAVTLCGGKPSKPAKF